MSKEHAIMEFKKHWVRRFSIKLIKETGDE